MIKINAAGLTEIAAERARKQEALKSLISLPFNADNPDHIAALKKHLDHFELKVNLMYFYQGLSNALFALFASYFVSYFIPLPDFVHYFTNMSIYLSAGAYILEKFSMTDFMEQFNDTKTMYTWCHLSLACPEVQRLIRLLAPLCNTEFMVKWDCKEESSNQNGWIEGARNLINSFSFYSKNKPKSEEERQQQIDTLKKLVEIRGLDNNIYDNFSSSIRYFACNPDFRAMMSEKLTPYISPVKSVGRFALSFAPTPTP